MHSTGTHARTPCGASGSSMTRTVTSRPACTRRRGGRMCVNNSECAKVYMYVCMCVYVYVCVINMLDNDGQPRSTCSQTYTHTCCNKPRKYPHPHPPAPMHPQHIHTPSTCVPSTNSSTSTLPTVSSTCNASLCSALASLHRDPSWMPTLLYPQGCLTMTGNLSCVAAA